MRNARTNCTLSRYLLQGRCYVPHCGPNLVKTFLIGETLSRCQVKRRRSKNIKLNVEQFAVVRICSCIINVGGEIKQQVICADVAKSCRKSRLAALIGGLKRLITCIPQHQMRVWVWYCKGMEASCLLPGPITLALCSASEVPITSVGINIRKCA